MKNRTVYLWFFALLAVIILSIYLTKEIAKNQIELQETRSGQEEQGRSSDQQDKLLSSGAKRAISLIKPAAKEKALRSPKSLEKEERRRRQLEESSSGSGKNTSRSKREAEQQSRESGSGIKKLNKYPSPQQQEEMQSQGIVIY